MRAERQSNRLEKSTLLWRDLRFDGLYTLISAGQSVNHLNFQVSQHSTVERLAITAPLTIAYLAHDDL